MLHFLLGLNISFSTFVLRKCGHLGSAMYSICCTHDNSNNTRTEHGEFSGRGKKLTSK